MLINPCIIMRVNSLYGEDNLAISWQVVEDGYDCGSRGAQLSKQNVNVLPPHATSLTLPRQA